MKSKMIRTLPVILAIVCFIQLASNSQAATTQQRYFAHDAAEDTFGVIVPWYKGQNGQFDFRVRIAAETLKRYPWVDASKAPSPAPHYVYNGEWKIDKQGTITIPGSQNPWNNGDLGQRANYVLGAFIDYYRYSGDPAAIAHISVLANILLDHCQTDGDHPWPNFLISCPVKGISYGKCDPHGFIQLDIVAEVGLELLRAYQLVGNECWLEAAKHWGDLFTKNCNLDSALPPWNRYANPEDALWNDLQTGGVSLVLLFLDELIRIGYAEENNAIIEARDAGRKYLKDTLLDRWTVHETWGRHYWDWDAFVQGEIITEGTAHYLMNNPDYFKNWKIDTRNIISLFLNHTSANPASNGNVYHGAWSYPESSGCCTRSLWYAPLQVAPVFARYGAMAGSEWGRELARRQMIMATYDCHPTGVVEDNIDGGQHVAGSWFKIAHPMALKHVLAAMAWLPDVFGANRENHIMRSSAVVNNVVYGKGNITYSTFDAPANTVDVLRLAFTPDSITADGKILTRREDLQENGYTVNKLKNGDCIVTIRHDDSKNVVVKGEDPQQQITRHNLIYVNDWTSIKLNEKDERGTYASPSPKAATYYTFTGNQVRMIGGVGPEGGLADVYVDGVKQLVGIDCWNPDHRRNQVLYYKNGLDNKEHTIKIAVRGGKNLISKGNNIYINGLQYSAATGDSGFGSGGGPTKIQRFIFGYPGRSDYIDSAGNSWRPATEFIIRSKEMGDTVVHSWWTQRKRWTMANTSDPELYCYGVHGQDFSTHFTVAPGTYYVRLKFTETRWRHPENSRMNIFINGKEVVTNMNIAATASGLSNSEFAKQKNNRQTYQAGMNKAVDLVFNDIRPQNGVIDIRLTGGNKTEAIVQAIEVGPGNGGEGATPISIPLPAVKKK